MFFFIHLESVLGVLKKQKLYIFIRHIFLFVMVRPVKENSIFFCFFIWRLPLILWFWNNRTITQSAKNRSKTPSYSLLFIVFKGVKYTYLFACDGKACGKEICLKLTYSRIFPIDNLLISITFWISFFNNLLVEIQTIFISNWLDDKIKLVKISILSFPFQSNFDLEMDWRFIAK